MSYLVDVGKLVKVLAPHVQDAFSLAVMAEPVTTERPRVYQLDPQGKPVEVFV